MRGWTCCTPARLLASTLLASSFLALHTAASPTQETPYPSPSSPSSPDPVTLLAAALEPVVERAVSRALTKLKLTPDSLQGLQEGAEAGRQALEEVARVRAETLKQCGGVDERLSALAGLLENHLPGARSARQESTPQEEFLQELTALVRSLGSLRTATKAQHEQLSEQVATLWSSLDERIAKTCAKQPSEPEPEPPEPEPEPTPAPTEVPTPESTEEPKPELEPTCARRPTPLPTDTPTTEPSYDYDDPSEPSYGDFPRRQEPLQSLALPACARSCLQLYQATGEDPLPDGVYQLTGQPAPVFCDFSHDGGGWTLLLTAVSKEGWSRTSLFSRNERLPSLTDNYSVLGRADGIRDLQEGGRFAYRIEAKAEVGRRRWGGIWNAPRSYSFTHQQPDQTDVDLLRRFNQWNYKDTGIEKRMPWVNLQLGYGNFPGPALLTTSSDAGEDWWGTLVSHPAHEVYDHSPWILPEQEMSGTVLYWVREQAPDLFP